MVPLWVCDMDGVPQLPLADTLPWAADDMLAGGCAAGPYDVAKLLRRLRKDIRKHDRRTPTMDPTTLQLLTIALQEAPQLITLASTEIAALKGTATPEQTAAIDAALDAAHAALQGAVPAT